MRRRLFNLGAMYVIMIPLSVQALDVKESEMNELRSWIGAKFEDKTYVEIGEPRIEVVENHDPVQVNNRNGRPMFLAGKEYNQGLYCHAPSHLDVIIPEGGSRFEALVGIDSNDQTSGGRGSVIASLVIDGVVTWKSEVLREGMPLVPVSVDLKNEKRFSLILADSGDGISCDQFDWAEARVILKGGKEVWLSDLPLVIPRPQPYTNEYPFSFVYADRSSRDRFHAWTRERSMIKLDDNRYARNLIYTDPDTGLQARFEAVEYKDFPVIEWTLYLKNTGTKDTPLIEKVLPLDTRFTRGGEGEYTLRYHTGDLCTADSYEPHQEVLAPNTHKTIANTGGRPTQSAFPYFNVGTSREGLLIVVSWAGQWSAQFTRDERFGLRVSAGQELTHFVLHPGEEVRSPMIVLMFWKGDPLTAQNLWRRWMIAHNLPRPGGKLPPAPMMEACSSHWFGEMINADSQSQKYFVDRYLEKGMQLDYWWMDAGWYVNQSGWPNTGTWEVDQKRFPGGFRPITDHIHSKGVKSLVWFEPERVTPGTWLYEQHPEWLLGKDGEQKLLNLGNPEAREWLTNHVDKILVEGGIDFYRQDFNMDPLPYWRANDTEDRRGITEIRHVEGYFAYWDELRKRHPEILIDSCASGGRRNDLETLRRAVPLLRSDYIMEPVGNQCHTYALSFWFPYYGTGTSKTSTYEVLSVLCPSFNACWDMRSEEIDWPRLAGIVREWKEYAPNFLGDYYPLTSYSLANDQWIAWQFNRPEVGEGMVQAFRRAESVFETARFRLNALDQEKIYKVWNTAGGQPIEQSGKDLMEQGLHVSMEERPMAVVYRYQSVK